MAATNQFVETRAYSAIPQAPNIFDVNGDNRLTELDVLMVLNGIGDSSRTSTISSREYLDVDSDGQVSLNDAWLIIRGIQIAQLNVRSVAATTNQRQINFGTSASSKCSSRLAEGKVVDTTESSASHRMTKGKAVSIEMISS